MVKPGFHTFVQFTLASKDGEGWTIEAVIDDIPHMVMGVTPQECFEKALEWLKASPESDHG